MLHYKPSTVIRWNADQLGIAKIPACKKPRSFFLTPTTMAALASDGSGIAINNAVVKSDNDLWFALSHEMRHLWQIRSNRADLTAYTASDAADTASYNAQDMELDAHSWSFAVMIKLFGITPNLRSSLGDEIYDEILRRCADIIPTIKR